MFGKLLEWILPHLYKNIFPRELDPVGFKVFKNHDFSTKSSDFRSNHRIFDVPSGRVEDGEGPRYGIQDNNEILDFEKF